MTILLTGCSGYIGSALIGHLRGLGHKVIGIDRRPYVGGEIDGFIHADLLDESKLRQAVSGVDSIFHLAAAKDDWGLSDDEYYRDNLTATKVVIEAGRRAGVTHWVFYSTVSVLGPSEIPLDESAPFEPTIAYGASKAEAEKLFHELAAHDRRAQVLIIRPSVVFGRENPPSTNIYRLIEAICKNRFLMIGNGAALKTTSYIDNLLAATLFLIPKMACGVQTYIYVDKPVLSTDDLVSKLYELLGKRRPSLYLPLWFAERVAHLSDIAAAITKIDFPITASRIKKFCTSTNFSSEAIRSLGFRQPVSIDDALEATVVWHLARRGHTDLIGSAPTLKYPAKEEVCTPE